MTDLEEFLLTNSGKNTLENKRLLNTRQMSPNLTPSSSADATSSESNNLVNIYAC